jgi:vancomycin resistance protein YoaR
MRKKLNWKNFILSLYIILILSVFYHISFAKKIIPGVKVGSVKVGGLSYENAVEKLKKYEETLDKKIIFKYEDNTFEITDIEIGFSYDWDASVSRAFEVGRTKNMFVDTKDKIAGLIKSLYLPPFYDYEDKVLENKLLIIKGELSKAYIDAKLILDEEEELSVTESEKGFKISEESLRKMVIHAFDRLDYGEKDLPVYEVDPKISKSDLEPVLDTVNDIISEDLIVTYKDKTWELTPNQTLDFLYFSKEDNKLEMSVSDSKFEAYTNLLRQEIDVLPRGQVTSVDGDRVISFEITENGVSLDDKKFMENFKNSLFGNTKYVEIPINIVSELDKDTYGIYTLLGEGNSKYTGSGTSRINNLTLAAQRTNGVLVPPGEIYSMNKAIGEISSQTGYDTAWVIRGGRTVLGEGGGVCQTSTTLFRAVLNSGLPIVKRYPHDYRVYYYEIDSPVGFDASIFQPSLDFQFKNDTPNYILVQSEWDLGEQSLTFKIYGTPDGRSVEISKPVVTGVTPPPDPLYQEDPTLPKGYTKQIDFSAWGANVSFTRVVTREDDIISEATFSSRYQPWKAIYLVGTKE